MKNQRILLAIGGNALLPKGSTGSAEEQIKTAVKTVKQLKEVLENNDVVITHGNGSQVGNLLIQQHACKEVPPMPLHVLVAMTQGQIGFFVEYAVTRNTKKSTTTIITHCEVDENDPAFKNPTKPIGPFYEEKKPGMILDAGRGYRMVVASPKVKRIIERDMIKKLVGRHKVVIAGGGGGIPISFTGEGLQAVIDKDNLAQVLGNQIDADLLLFVTAIDAVYLNFGKKNQKRIEKMNIKEAKKYLEEGHFEKGSMKPKMEAAIKFLEEGGKKAIVCSTNNAQKSLEGEAGTTITRD